MSSFKGTFNLGGYSTNNPQIKLFRRKDTMDSTIQRFVRAIQPGTLAWDQPTGQLLYKDTDSKVWSAKFVEFNEVG